MRIKNLNYFIEIERTGSINKASKKLFTSPQNLSRIIKSIEEELNVKLLERKRDGIEITDRGLVFLNFCKNTMDSFNQMLLEISDQEINEKISGNVRIFVTKILSETFFIDILMNFKKFFPNITVQMIEVDALKGYNLIKNEPQSIGALSIIPLSEEYNNIEFYNIGELEYGVAVHNQHPFAERHSVDINEVVKEDIMIFTQNDISLSETYLLINQLQNDNLNLDSTSNVTAFFSSVNCGNNLIFMFKELFYTKHSSKYPNINFVDIEGINNKIKFAIVENKNASRTEAETAFLDFTKHYLSIFS